MSKVKNLVTKKPKIGKYSKVLCADESMLDETIELLPDDEVGGNPATAALDIMDVVELPNDTEVVVVKQPDPEDETIKVQDTETKVTADLPVEAFSKSTKISKSKLKAYSESQEAELGKEVVAEATEAAVDTAVHSEECPVEAAAEVAAGAAEAAAEVPQPEGTDSLPISIKKVDNGFEVTVNGETKIAADLAAVHQAISEAFNETQMDTFSKRHALIRSKFGKK